MESGMKLIMLPVLLSVAYIGFEHRDAIVDQYRAAYPADPAKREALEQCARIDANFNRLDMIDRDNCYAAIAPKVAISTTANAASVSYAFNPSHLPANDIRRNEANAAYGAARSGLAVPAISR
jgi:hypothetical protein